jgi:hypothetical protein
MKKPPAGDKHGENDRDGKDDNHRRGFGPKK